MRLKEIGAKNDMPRGWYSESIVHKKIYTMWRGILDRCYCEEGTRYYQWYKDCICHPDFLLLSNFVKWVEQEPNYPLLVEDPGCFKWTIDKDGLVLDNKEYVPGKIRLVTSRDNTAEVLSRKGSPFKNSTINMKAIISINIMTYDINYYSSIKDAFEKGYARSKISCCLNKHQEVYKKCKWFFATDLLEIMKFFKEVL